MDSSLEPIPVESITTSRSKWALHPDPLLTNVWVVENSGHPPENITYVLDVRLDMPELSFRPDGVVRVFLEGRTFVRDVGVYVQQTDAQTDSVIDPFGNRWNWLVEERFLPADNIVRGSIHVIQVEGQHVVVLINKLNQRLLQLVEFGTSKH